MKPEFVLILALASSSGHATELPIEMGLMTCSFSVPAASPSLPKVDTENLVGGQRDIECSFRVGLEGPDEIYVGTLQFVGQAKEVLGKGALMFVAKAPGSSQFKVGMMEGKYATQALSPSGSQRPLVGEKKTSILLHPLSHNYDRPALAIGRPPGLIVLLELKLKGAPA